MVLFKLFKYLERMYLLKLNLIKVISNEYEYCGSIIIIDEMYCWFVFYCENIMWLEFSVVIEEFGVFVK